MSLTLPVSIRKATNLFEDMQMYRDMMLKDLVAQADESAYRSLTGRIQLPTTSDKEEEMNRVHLHQSTPSFDIKLKGICVGEEFDAQNWKFFARNWEFFTHTIDMICFEEIQDIISRRNPLVVFQFEDQSGIVCIHHTLAVKSDICNIPMPDALTKNVNADALSGIAQVFYVQTLHLSEWKQWATEVKKATWPALTTDSTERESSTALKVRVIVPKI